MQFSGGGGIGGSSVVMATGFVAASETTASAAYVDLATVGPTAQLSIGASGVLEVELAFGGSHTVADNLNIMSFALTGANVLAANDANSLTHCCPAAATFERHGATVTLSGLTPGVTTVTAKYRTGAATATFNSRSLVARSY